MSKVKDTLAQRGNRYGTMEDNAEVTQRLLEVIYEYGNWDDLDRIHKEVLHMIFGKVSRMVCGDKDYADNPHDIAGYATLLEEYLNDLNNS